MNLIFLCVLVLSAVHSSLQQISWNGDWAFACDFTNHDLTSAQVPGDQCSTKCAQTSGCTHYSWTNWNRGTCWMKSGAVGKSDAIFNGKYDMVCGVLPTAQTTGKSI